MENENIKLLNDLRFVARYTTLDKPEIIKLAAKIKEKNTVWSFPICLQTAARQINMNKILGSE